MVKDNLYKGLIILIVAISLIFIISSIIVYSNMNWESTCTSILRFIKQFTVICIAKGFPLF